MSDNRNIEITEMAVKTIERMQERVRSVRAFYGDDEGNRVAASLAHGLSTLLMNADYISQDDDLSLIVQYRWGITVGMVFHREPVETTIKRHHPAADMSLLSKLDPPQSGEWSLHS